MYYCHSTTQHYPYLAGRVKQYDVQCITVTQLPNIIHFLPGELNSTMFNILLLNHPIRPFLILANLLWSCALHALQLQPL